MKEVLLEGKEEKLSKLVQLKFTKKVVGMVVKMAASAGHKPFRAEELTGGKLIQWSFLSLYFLLPIKEALIELISISLSPSRSPGSLSALYPLLSLLWVWKFIVYD